MALKHLLTTPLLPFKCRMKRSTVWHSCRQDGHCVLYTASVSALRRWCAVELRERKLAADENACTQSKHAESSRGGSGATAR